MLLVCIVSIFATTLAERHGGMLQKHGENSSEMLKRFQGSEHRRLANSGGYIELIAGPDGADNSSNPQNQEIRVNESLSDLQFVNSLGVNLHTYGDIVAFAGDFFGPKNPATIICSGGDPEEEVCGHIFYFLCLIFVFHLGNFFKKYDNVYL